MVKWFQLPSSSGFRPRLACHEAISPNAQRGTRPFLPCEGQLCREVRVSERIPSPSKPIDITMALNDTKGITLGTLSNGKLEIGVLTSKRGGHIHVTWHAEIKTKWPNRPFNSNTHEAWNSTAVSGLWLKELNGCQLASKRWGGNTRIRA